MTVGDDLGHAVNTRIRRRRLLALLALGCLERRLGRPFSCITVPDDRTVSAFNLAPGHGVPLALGLDCGGVGIPPIEVARELVPGLDVR
jgi:hypothetical protein